MTENAQFTRSCKEDEVKETDAYELKATDKKGRILVARKAFQPGDVILTDSPVVSASWHLYKCFSCNTPHPTSSCEKVRINFPAMPLLLMSANITLQLMDGVFWQSVNIGRNVITFLHVCVLQREDQHVRQLPEGDAGSPPASKQDPY